MPDFSKPSEFIGIGLPGDCCICGTIMIGTGTSSCSGVCDSKNGNLYGSSPGEDDTPCFPQMCCPCSPTGDLTLTLTASPCGVNETITLNAADGINICSGTNPRQGNGGSETCYNYAAISGAAAKGQAIPYEKYGKLNHVFASAGACTGAKADISLCCCDGTVLGSDPISGEVGECHTCNYTLSIQWKVIHEDRDADGKYCDCPEATGSPPLVPLLPGSANSADTNDTIYNSFSLINSRCEPFYLEFESPDDLYWNCGPCLNGSETSDNDVQITATIVPA
tara:strand:- start:4837 stop:5676 length:840 start_codon:yes stop_codon:yes gene_type:complete